MANQIAEDGSLEVSSDTTEPNLDEVAGVDSVAYDPGLNFIDNTAFGADGKSGVKGLGAHTVTVSGNMDEADTGQENIRDWLEGSGQRYIRARPTVGTGFKEREGLADLVSYSESQDKDGLVRFSATFQFDGAPTTGDQV